MQGRLGLVHELISEGTALDAERKQSCVLR